MMHFYNLPSKCTITIYSLAGEIVDVFSHDSNTYSGEDITWYEDFAGDGIEFSGGMHSWDVVSESDQAVATGMYLYTVKNDNSGDVQRGKIVIIK